MPGSMMLARRIKDAVIPATTGTMATYPTGTTASIEVDSSGTAGTAGSPMTEIAAASVITSEYRITSVVVSGFESATRYTFTLGYGTAGSETVLGTFSVAAGATTDAFVVPVSMPNIPANSRVAIQSAVLTGTNQHCDIAINYVTV